LARRCSNACRSSPLAGCAPAGYWPNSVWAILQSKRPRIAISTPSEIDWLESLPQLQQAMAATLIFSAKEAFYKCQYPLVRERLNFHDVTVEVLAWGADQGSFAIHATRRIALAESVTLPLKGHYLFHEQFVTVGVVLTAAGALSQ